MSAFRLIVMPYELGRLRDGVGRGPARLLGARGLQHAGVDGLRLFRRHGPGHPHARLRAALPGSGPVPEEAVVLAGARDFDENEQARLSESRITHLPPEALTSAEPLLEAVEPMSPSGVFVHVDLDVLDPADGRVNIYSAPAGVRAAQLEAIVSELLERLPVRALSLTAYDPEADPDGRVPPIALGLLRRLAAAGG